MHYHQVNNEGEIMTVNQNLKFLKMEKLDFTKVGNVHQVTNQKEAQKLKNNENARH